MVRFGHFMRANRIPGWEKYYIGYKPLKKRINDFAARAPSASEQERQEMKKSFSDLLDYHVEKIVLFLIERQGLLAEELQRLREIRDSTPCEDVENSLSSAQLMEQYRKVGLELLRLLQFLELNTTGLRKILKKFEKRVSCVFRDHYIASRANHPYSQLNQIFRQVGIEAMVATISQNLAELGAKGTISSSSFFRHPALPAKVVAQEPIIQAIEVARQKLTKEVSFTSFVANELLLPAPLDALPGGAFEEGHPWSMYLNLFNTFLYMVNYYIVVPTSDDYAERLDAPPTLCGVIIGSMPFTALVSAFVYSWWSNFSYKAPLILSTIILVAGNLLYALALNFNSVWLLLIGRALCGLGGARALNRRYIADHVPVKQRTQASAAFVSASALGMAIGPALAGLFDFVDFEIWGAPVNNITAPGWLLAVLWAMYLLLLLCCFTEPPVLTTEEAPLPRTVSERIFTETDKLNAPLLAKSKSLPYLSTDSGEEEDGEKEHDPKAGHPKLSVETLRELFQELTLPVKLLLWVYFALKFASEMLVSESSVTTSFYFHWDAYQVGIFLGLLGFTVLPMSAVVGNFISNISEDRLVILWAEIMTAVGVLGILSYNIWFPYTSFQYVAAAIVIFVSTNVLEGVTMSLLSKVMSARMARGIFNCGFLSTEAGTLARVVANATITLVGGLSPVENLTNFSMLPTLVVMFVTTFYTYLYYFTLY